MKTLRYLLVLGSVLVASFTQAQYILTVNFEQMDPYIGKSFTLMVKEIGTDKEVGRKEIPVIGSADFSVELYTLLHGRSYNVDFTVDINGNSSCDVPPVDHSWRRTVMNALQHTTINFVPDDTFTNIDCQDAFPYSQYDGTWGGRWRNLTFGSTDTIRASYEVTCDSVYGFFMTAGVFGNPQPVVFNFAEEIPEGSGPADTLIFSPPAPWAGQISIIEGTIEGSIAMSGFTLQFTGTVGATQVLCLYEVFVGGNALANGYFYIRELEITDSAEDFEVETIDFENISCPGASDGFIWVEGLGGTPGNYQFIWSNGASTLQIESLPPGEYCVTVTDAVGCTATQWYTITEPTAMSLSTFAVDAGCYGTCDGVIILSVSGGTPPYFYIWDGNVFPSNVDIADLCSGQYTITVSDDHGCTATSTVSINEPDTVLITDIAVVHATNGESNGTITVTVSGGISPYLYSLDGTAFQTSPMFTNLPPGLYTVVVMDVNGCEIESMEIEIQNISRVEELEKHFRLYPNPASSHLFVESDIPVSVKILDVYGNVVAHEQKSGSHRIALNGVLPGVYIAGISDGVHTTHQKLIVL